MEWSASIEGREITTRVRDLVPAEAWAELTDSERAAWVHLAAQLHEARVRGSSAAELEHDLGELARRPRHVASTALGYCSTGLPVAESLRRGDADWHGRSPLPPPPEAP